MSAIIDRGLTASPVFDRAVMSVTPQLLGTVFTAVTGASITLPTAGTYRVYYHLRGVVDDQSKNVTTRLFNVTTSTNITATESIPNFIVVSAANVTNLQGTASMEVVLTVESPTTINLEAKGSVATGTEVRSDTSGRTVIGFNKLGNVGGGGGTAAAGLQKGDAKGFVVRLINTAVVRITLGSIEANGKIYTLAANSFHAITGFTGGYDIHYIYIDDSASTAPTAVFINSTTDPVFDSVKDGFYNGDDRMIGCFTEKQAGGEVGFFETVVMSDRFIRNTINRAETPKLATNQNPGGAGVLVIPNINNSDALLPVNAVEMLIGMSVTDAAGQTVTVAAATEEWFLEDSLVINAPFKSAGVASIFDSTWLTLALSRQIEIGAETNDDPGSMNAEMGGFGYIR